MKLLSLDQASRITGWAVFDNNILLDHGTFTTDNPDIGERLHRIREFVAQQIADYGIEYVAFEDIQLQRDKINNVQTFKVLAEVFGVIYELIIALELPYTIVHSQTWKSTCGIKGKTRDEQKRNAKEFVTNTYGIKATQDESDAICIGTHILKQLNKKPDFDWSE